MKPAITPSAATNSAMNQGWTYRDRIHSTTIGQTVLDYYTKRYPHSSRDQWQARITQKQILLDGHPTTTQAQLCAGQLLTYYRPPWQEPAAPLNFKILYEDDDLWGIAKPSGLPVLPGGGFLEHTLLHQLRSRYPDETPVPVHRLGRGTSGVMLIAKSQAARKDLSQQFRVRTAKATSVHGGDVAASSLSKVYRALVGPAKPSELSEQFTCTYPIGKLPYPGLSYLYGHTPAGMAAYSQGQVLQRRADSTLVEISIATGRPHQIRIHLAAAGYPMLGDPLYAIGGVPIAGGSAMPGDCGYHLHACWLRFSHPRTGQSLCIEAEPPPALKLTET